MHLYSVNRKVCYRTASIMATEATAKQLLNLILHFFLLISSPYNLYKKKTLNKSRN
jgi:hypothetical protein